MIKSFKCKDSEKLFHGIWVKAFSGIERQAFRRLRILDDADNLNDLRVFPSNAFEALKGDRKGQYSIRINKQWRICFTWEDGADDVEIIDYH